MGIASDAVKKQKHPSFRSICEDEKDVRQVVELRMSKSNTTII